MIGRLTAVVGGAASLLAIGAALTASSALAHPLGNFTTNQLAQVRIDERQARVHYVLDQAEIPTFQQVQRFDASGNGTIEGADRGASFQVRPGSGEVTAPPGLEGGTSTENRALDGFANSLAGADSHGLLILLLLAAAFGWGALHALSPGHGKAMVAAYLVGSRGTPRHALILGLTMTATHTAAVFALGLVTLAASQYVLPEDLYPWLGVASGLMVVGIGFAVMRSRLRRWRSQRSHSHDGHSHAHDHSHGQPLTVRGLVALGVSGGLVPCPSALVVLIAAISQHRRGRGIVLIGAFSLGLAATLTAVGLTVIWGGRALARLRPERRLFGGRLTGALPAVSASVIVLAGTLITLRAIPQLGG